MILHIFVWCWAEQCFMDFTLSWIFPPFLYGLYISVKSGLCSIRFVRDVKTEHLIIFSCIKHWFKAITF